MLLVSTSSPAVGVAHMLTQSQATSWQRIPAAGFDGLLLRGGAQRTSPYLIMEFLEFMSKNISVQDWYNENKDAYIQGGDVLLSDTLDVFLTYVPKEGRILDMGCGAGRDVDYFVQKGYYAVGIDISNEMIKHARTHFQGEFLISDVTETQLPEKSFDAVWSSSALFTHLDKDERTKALEEVVRILKPEGVFGFIVMKNDSRPLPPKPIPFYRFTEEELESELSEQGLKIESINLISFRTREWIVCIAKVV